MNATVLITGGSGLLATNWALAIRDDHPVILGLHQREISLAGVTTKTIDLESVDELRRSFDLLQPRLVIHTAGLTNVEDCEAKPELAHHLNVELAATVARACADLDIPLIHISTDHLFSGEQAQVNESAPIAPVNQYARTKAEAEIQVLDNHPHVLVLRTNFFAWGPSYRQSFSDIIIEALRAGEEITLFKDVFFTPILVEVLVEAAHELVATNSEGIFHLVGDERISKFDFGQKLADTFGLDSSFIKSGLLRDHEELVERPQDMSLSNRKASALLGRNFGDIDEQLAGLLQQENLGIAHEVQNL